MKPEVIFDLENAEWPVLLVDANGVIHRVNQGAVKVFGSEPAPSHLAAIWSPENGSTAEEFMAQWERSPLATVPLKFVVKGGGVSTFVASVCSSPQQDRKLVVVQLLPEAGFVAEDLKSSESIIQKQKLDCALQLARTVSLDFNNALTSILGHTSLLLSLIETDHPWRNSLLEVEKSAAKAAEIANDLGDFSRQEKEPRGQTAGNLNSILQRSVEVLQKSQTQKIEWLQQLERKLFSVKYDEAKMQQAFVKILENGAQAVGATGRISIQSRNVEFAEPTQDRDLRLAAGTYVCVEISDNGCGIAPEILPRIFEPFFTTKKEGGHRGLGLAWVYGIVTNHGGGVSVSSQVGVGTSVRVYLPAEKKIARDTAINPDNLTGVETILMVDDEDLLLTMGQTVLSAFGYRVLTANSGQKALEIISNSENKIDLVITDMVMPAMSGRELADHIHRTAPHTRILCTSGFVRPSGDSQDSNYLQKPFTSQDLLVKVKQMLTPNVG